MKKIISILILGLILGIVVISGCTSSGTGSSNSQPTASVSSTTSSFQPLTFSGSGEKATKSFDWPGGMMKIQMSHTGKSNFIVHLVSSSDGDTQEWVENEIGKVNDNSRVFSVPAGNYLFDVQADGSWNIQVSK